MAVDKQQGKVKFFQQERGYGFVIPNNGNGTEDLFFHATKVIGKHPVEGDIVEYVVADGKKGLCAIEVQVI